MLDNELFLVATKIFCTDLIALAWACKDHINLYAMKFACELKNKTRAHSELSKLVIYEKVEESNELKSK